MRVKRALSVLRNGLVGRPLVGIPFFTLLFMQFFMCSYLSGQYTGKPWIVIMFYVILHALESRQRSA